VRLLIFKSKIGPSLFSQNYARGKKVFLSAAPGAKSAIAVDGEEKKTNPSIIL
jgi:hypothetical protein